jgi:hypothetical protein
MFWFIFFQVMLVWACEAGLALYIVWTGAGVWSSGCWGCFLQAQRLVELLSKVSDLFIFSKSWSPNEVHNLPLARYPFLFGLKNVNVMHSQDTKRCFCFVAIALPYKLKLFWVIVQPQWCLCSFRLLGGKSSPGLWVLKIFDIHPHNFGTMIDQLLIMLYLQHTCCGYHYNSEKMADIFGLFLLYLLRLCMSRCMHSI